MATERGEIVVKTNILREGFVQIPVTVLQLADLGAGAKLAYGLLLWYAWKGDGWPGHKEAAQAFGIGERSIYRYMSDLVDHGLVTVERHGLGETNTYYLEDLSARLAGQTCQSGSSDLPDWQHNNDNTLLNTLKTNTKVASSSSQQPFDDKTALISTIALEFASADPSQAIQTYLTRFPHALISKAAEITRAADNKHNPIAYLYGVIQRLQEQEAFEPLAHRHIDLDQFELSPAEYEAALASLDRVKSQLAAQRQAEGKQ